MPATHGLRRVERYAEGTCESIGSSGSRSRFSRCSWPPRPARCSSRAHPYRAATARPAIARLSAPLAIDLDARAVPRIHGATFEDVLRGEGYMHAQERFFQMDLLRRSTAGELAALIGARVLPLDRAQRPFDYRRRAHELLARLPAREQGWLAAYTDGVNAGLEDLRSRPPEYWLLGSRPDLGLPRTRCSSCSASTRGCRTTTSTSGRRACCMRRCPKRSTSS